MMLRPGSATPHFRSLRSTSQLARDQAFAYGQLAVDIAGSLERHVEFPTSTFRAFQSPRIPAISTAQRKLPGLFASVGRSVMARLGRLIRLLKHRGILVVFSPSQAASVDAYSFTSRLRPVVVLNPIKRDYYRQRST